MASLARTPYGVYELTFYYGRERIKRSLRTKSEKTADKIRTAVEAALRLLEAGHIDVPPQVTRAQLWRILISSGHNGLPAPRVTDAVGLDRVCTRYLESYTSTTKEESTIVTEKHHANHLKRILGADTSLSEITPDELRNYVKRREAEPGTHGRNISALTISKELQTFRQLWEFAAAEGMVAETNPLTQVRKPRPAEKPRFMTMEEVERALSRGGLSEADVAMFWESLFLRETEIAEFLEHVRHSSKSYPRFNYIYPAIAFCAYTGCRRSEMFRAQITDMESAVIQLREKKRSQRETFTFRQVPKHPQLLTILDEWLQRHPGGQHLFCKNNLAPLEDKTSRDAFAAVAGRSKWSVLRGYHILRHSFASNLARHGVDQRTIDEFMGHQTEASRKRYRHLFPEDIRSAIQTLDLAVSKKTPSGLGV